ncbi:SubName: Full=Uncharacterized protein {ECO:0000313/EMBL:CCA66659.1} [Serendipita indica DSM 11827]|uniref:Uncharacterized protein n=1 Tax=Serendipita indica (strain DSM 11827) TaxID=1109443 RepID=G4T5S2_SERID|nr:SubName: Full=Uncharacterized protein {ECO:0000313/EMBL:CCA66659.1} [Serendipita indica DSM 11827]CCA66659.1 hypothetical protein PIIN_00341 [Serendipita indica DSM 11827]
MAANVDGLGFLNYSRPIIVPVASPPPPRPLRSPDRARTDDERPRQNVSVNRVRARSVPRARAVSTPSPPPFAAPPSAYASTSRRQRESILSQQSSLYPPSTVTSSAFSGPETPPEHSVELPLLDADDVSYRLKLLVKNNYFLPPPHVKPTQLSSTPPTPHKPPTLRTLFRPNKSPKSSPSTPQIPAPAISKPRNTRPQNRVVVIREQLQDLSPEPLPQSDDANNTFYDFVDPTTAVDAVQYVAPPRQVVVSPQQPTGDWRKDLLQQAVGLSLVSPPVRKQSLPSEQNPSSSSYGQPITSLPTLTAASGDARPLRLQEPNSSTLNPPPRPRRDRTRSADESPVQRSSPPAELEHSPKSIVQHLQEHSVDSERTSMFIRPSFTQSPRPSLSQSMPYGASPFGLSTEQPRYSAATEFTQSHYDDQEAGRNTPSRPSMSASSIHSAPRPSISESRVSHYSATFGERRREPKSRASNDQGSSNSSLAYLRCRSRSRSLSPSRRTSSSTTQQAPPPPVPPLPSSDTEGHSTIIYVHPTGALSNSALGPTTPSTAKHHTPVDNSPVPTLDPRRGITNCPPISPSSPRFFAFRSPKTVPQPLSVTVDVEPTNESPTPVDAATRRAEGITAVEQWRDTQAQQEEARKFDGMIVQHLESEKDRFRQIANRGRAE